MSTAKPPVVVAVVEDDAPSRIALGRLLRAAGFEPAPPSRCSQIDSRKRRLMLSTRPRVLLADDYPDMVKAVSRRLALDCEIVGTVADGGALVETAQRLQPDVIVLDANLPNVNSLEACREILRVNPAMKVVMFTAMDGPNTGQAFVEAGASAFVSKLASVDLLATIKRLCATELTTVAPNSTRSP